MNSLDPRVNRLPEILGALSPKPALDQLGNFEVFVQPKDGKPFQHEGAIHAPDREMAFILAKESLTRRFTCVSIFVVDTRDIGVSGTTDADRNAYETISESTSNLPKISFEVFHLPKRGKQHVHVGSVEAGTVNEAFHEAKKKFGGMKVFNVWVAPTNQIRFTTPEEKDLWNTLPEKKFRDAGDYKGGDKLKEFLERRK